MHSMAKRQKTGDCVGTCQESPRVPLITVIQQPPGSGKTYGMVHDYLCTAPERGYRWVFVVTKPHSAKEVVRREIDDQFTQLCERTSATITEQIYYNKCHIIEVAFDDQTTVRYFVSTGDSFLWPQWVQTTGGPSDIFEKMCRQIADNGTSPIFRFKGARGHISDQALVCIDEATKFDAPYYDTFMRLVGDRKCDLVVTGDMLQSIEYDDSLLARMMKTSSIPGRLRVDIRQGNEVRRCGHKLVDMFSTVVGHDNYAKHGLSIPVSVHQDFDPTYEIITHEPLPSRNDETSIEKSTELAGGIARQMGQDVRRLYLLPEDVIVVMPLVKSSPLACALQTHINQQWEELLADNDYVASMRENRPNDFGGYVRMRDEQKTSREWYCVHHYSQEGTPIDTRRSDRSTRIVSVHASQGDGRRLAITVDLTYQNLCAFVFDTHPQDTLKYNSFVNVALSRCKQHQTVWLAQHQNDIWNRFVPFLTKAQRSEVPPNIGHMTRALKCSFLKIDAPVDGKKSAPVCAAIREKLDSDADFAAHEQIVEWEHHAVSLEVFVVHSMLRLAVNGHLKSLWCILGGNRGDGSAGIKEGKLEVLQVKKFYGTLSKQKKHRCDPNVPGEPLATVWPMMQHRGDGWEAEASEYIQAKMHALKRMLHSFCRDKASSSLMDKSSVQPMHLVCLSYLLNLHKYGDECGCSNTTLYDIARAYMHSGDIVDMYDRVKGCESIMDHVQSVCPEGQWDHAPRLHLGTVDNKTPKYFQVKIESRHNLWLHTNSHGATFLLITPIGPNLDSVLAAILTSALIAWQPDCSDPTKKTPPKVHGKPIHAIVVDISTLRVHHLRDLHVALDRDHPLIVDRILMEIDGRNRMHHEVVAQMICTEEGRALIAKQRRFRPEHLNFVSDMVEEGDLEEHVDAVKRKLDEKLTRHVEVFRKSVCRRTHE